MHKYLLLVSAKAESDIAEIFDYIAKDNREAAKKLVKLFNDKFEHLLIFPNSGFKKPDYIIKDVLFCSVAKHYKIIYAIKNDFIYIYRVVSDYQNILK